MTRPSSQTHPADIESALRAQRTQAMAEPPPNLAASIADAVRRTNLQSHSAQLTRPFRRVLAIAALILLTVSVGVVSVVIVQRRSAAPPQLSASEALSQFLGSVPSPSAIASAASDGVRSPIDRLLPAPHLPDSSTSTP